MGCCLLFQQCRLVDTLSPRDNLLPANEEIVTVGKFRIFGTGHRVKRANSERELIHEIEIRIVLGLHQIAEFLLVFRAQVVVVILVNSCLP